MKIKTETYGIFYKDKDTWRGPLFQELLTLDDIRYNSELENENEPIEKHIKSYLKSVAKSQKKKVKLMRQIWKSEK